MGTFDNRYQISCPKCGFLNSCRRKQEAIDYARRRLPQHVDCMKPGQAIEIYDQCSRWDKKTIIRIGGG